MLDYTALSLHLITSTNGVPSPYLDFTKKRCIKTPKNKALGSVRYKSLRAVRLGLEPDRFKQCKGSLADLPLGVLNAVGRYLFFKMRQMRHALDRQILEVAI